VFNSIVGRGVLKDGGRYYPWVKAGMLEDWIIIDCASSLPVASFYTLFSVFDSNQVAHIIIGHSDPKLWTDIFENDYSQLLVFDYKNNAVAGPTILTN